MNIEYNGVGSFHGFEIEDGTHRFLLSDFTVTHNCDFSGRTVIGPDPTLRLGELAVPVEIATNLTIPERVTSFNMNYLTKLVHDEKANYILRNNGKNKVNLKYALNQRGTELLYGDIIGRNGKKITVLNRPIHLQQGDQIERNGVALQNVQFPQKKRVQLNIGDVVERHLRDGDIVLLNRQPTLHVGSMLAQRIVVRSCKTLRFNLAIAKSFNADFDGDEMNIHVPQSLESKAELQGCSMAKQHIVSGQASRPIICIVQDSLLGAYKMTHGTNVITRSTFFDISQKTNLSTESILQRIEHIRAVLTTFNKNPNPFTGKGLFSLLLPLNFNYTKRNNAHPVEVEVKIYRGVLYEGTIDKNNLGAVNNSLLQLLNKEYDEDICSTFIDNIQFITNAWLLKHGFSVGLGDCIMTDSSQQTKINDIVEKCFLEAEGIKNTTQHTGIREIRINASLSKARDIGLRFAKDSLRPDNNFLSTVTSGSKGDIFNIAQITGLLGQQNLLGKRIPLVLNNKQRSLPHYHFGQLPIHLEYESRGFIRHSFIKGLNPMEFYFHAMSGREGICDTAMGTSRTGYMQRRIVKVCEDISIKYDGTVRDTTGKVYQMAYGDNGMDSTQQIHHKNSYQVCDISRMIERINMEHEITS